MQSPRRCGSRLWRSALRVGSLLGLWACVSSCQNPYEPPRVPPVISEDRDPAWSADGQWLAFQHSGDDSTPGLYIARVDGTGRQLVVPGGNSADWSPGGTALVLGIGFSYQVYRVDLATDSVTPLTTSGFNVLPAWSPDGQTIAFDSDDGTGGPTGLWLMDGHGGNRRAVAVGTPDQPGPGDVDWAPSGDRLVGERAWPTAPGSFRWRLFRTDTTGRDTAWLTPVNVDAQRPAWSPLGTWIAYVRANTDRPGDLWLIRPEGTEDHLLVRSGSHPTWSPDGASVAFSRTASDEVAIWSVDLEGRNLRQLSWPRGTPAARVLVSRASPRGVP